MYPLIHMAVLAATIFVLARLLPDVRIRSVGTAVLVAVVFSVLNFCLGWLIRALLFRRRRSCRWGCSLLLCRSSVRRGSVLWLTDKAHPVASKSQRARCSSSRPR